MSDDEKMERRKGIENNDSSRMRQNVIDYINSDGKAASKRVPE